MGFFDFIGDIFGASTQQKTDKFNMQQQVMMNDINQRNAMAMNQASLDNQNYINSQNIAMQEAANAANLQYQRETNAGNFAAQDAANKNSIQWRVADAVAAGLHPLYALGAPTMSPATMVAPQVQAGVAAPSASFSASQGVAPQRVGSANYMASMGQNLSRAISSMMTKEERARQAARIADKEMLQDTMDHIGVDNAMLQNDLLRSQIARNQRDQTGPPAPSMKMNGVASSARVAAIPASPTLNSLYDRSQEAGAISDKSYIMSGKNELIPAQSYDFKQRSDEDFVGNRMWDFRNRVVPFFKKNNPVPNRKDFPLPKGQQWGYDRWRGSYRPFYSGSRKWVQ